MDLSFVTIMSAKTHCYESPNRNSIAVDYGILSPHLELLPKQQNLMTTPSNYMELEVGNEQIL